MSYKPSDTLAFQFTTTSATGALADADSTPTGAMVENGVDDGAVTVTITSPATGIYKGVATVPADYTIGTHIEIRISATIGGVATGSVFDFGTIETKRVAELNDIAAGAEMDLVDAPNSTAITAIQSGLATPTNITAGTITTTTNLTNNNDKTGYSISGTKQTLDALNDIDGSSVTVTTNSDKTGYALTSAYDAAKTASQAGDAMDLIDAPNSIAITAIQSGLATPTNITAGTITTTTNLTNNNDKTGYALTSAYDLAKTASQAGDAMDLIADSIKATTFDESTAFPVTAADTGATYIARAPDGSYTLSAIASIVSGIGSGSGSALYFAAIGDNVISPLKGITFVGTQTTGTFADTQAENGSLHTITDSGTATDIDIVYHFTIGSNRRASDVTWRGHITNNDVCEVYAYDFSTSSWDAVPRKVITGQVATTNITVSINLLEKHTGTGTEAGHVYIRFQAVGESAIVIYTDELLAVGQAVSSTTGYSDGAVWVSDGGVSGITPDVNGTADNPCPWADALVVAAAKGLTRFRIRNGMTVTLSSTLENKSLLGSNWLLALGGQNISGSFISGAKVTGIASGTNNVKFEYCAIGTATIPSSGFYSCGIGFESGTFTSASAGEYSFVDCFSLVAGSGTPIFNFAGMGSTTGVNIRRWSGGSTIIGDTNVTCSLEVLAGGGQTITTGGGDFEIRGNCRSIALTLSGSETVQTAAITGPITISGTATAATVNIYELHAEIIDTSTGSTVNDYALKDFDAATTGVIVTTVNDKTGYALTSTYDLAKTASQAGDAMDLIDAPNAIAITAIQSGLATPTNITAGTITTVTNLTNAPTVGDLTADMKSSVTAAATAATPTISSVTTVTNLTNLPTAPTDWLTAASVKADAVTKFQSGLATPTNITAGTIANVTNTVSADIVSIDSSTESATNLAASTKTIVIGTISNSSFLPTETEFEASDITTATTGQYISRIVIFVTGDLKGQMKDISGYLLVGGKGHFTVSNFTSPPTDGDTFVII